MKPLQKDRTEKVLRDKDGDLVELLNTPKGTYVTVEQGGVIATAGPFKKRI